jgi:colanic acid/amylovoran biosynthesis protein
MPMPLDPGGFVSRAIHRVGRWRLVRRFQPAMVLAQFHAFVGFAALAIRLRKRWPRIALALLPPRLGAVIDAIDRADLCVGVPGGYLMAPAVHDDYWLYQAATLMLPAMLGKRLVLYACSIGPFAGLHRGVARRVLSSVDLVISREEISRANLRALGVDGTRVAVRPDAAFGFASAPQPEAALERALRSLSAAPRPWVGFSVRDHHFPGAASPEEKRAAYLNEIRAAVAWVRDELGGSAIFVPQCIENGGRDVEVSLEVARQASGAGNLFVLTEDLSPHALGELYARLDLLIGTRMHANILAMTRGTPVVAIAYEHKTVGIMQMMALSEYALDIADIRDRLLPMARRAWEARGALRSHVAQRVAALRREALATPLLLSPYLTRAVAR